MNASKTYIKSCSTFHSTISSECQLLRTSVFVSADLVQYLLPLVEAMSASCRGLEFATLQRRLQLSMFNTAWNMYQWIIWDISYWPRAPCMHKHMHMHTHTHAHTHTCTCTSILFPNKEHVVPVYRCIYMISEETGYDGVFLRCFPCLNVFCQPDLFIY